MTTFAHQCNYNRSSGIPPTGNNSIALPNLHALSTNDNEPSPVKIIDVDLFKFTTKNHVVHAKPVKMSCRGFILDFLNGKSPHACDPFALHDTLILSWDYVVHNDIMTLYSRSCIGKLEGTLESCHACLDLVKNESLERSRLSMAYTKMPHLHTMVLEDSMTCFTEKKR